MARYDNARAIDSEEPHGTLRGEPSLFYLEVKEARSHNVYIASTKEHINQTSRVQCSHGKPVGLIGLSKLHGWYYNDFRVSYNCHITLAHLCLRLGGKAGGGGNPLPGQAT